MGEESEWRFTYNLGVPLKSVDERFGLSSIYEELAFRALRLSAEMEQGIKLEKVRGWIAALKSTSTPDSKTNPVQLRTEAGAALVGWLLSPNSRPGMYAILDIGAWTTDISVFRCIKAADREGGKVSSDFYSTEVARNAMNEIDELTRTGLRRLWSLNDQPGQTRPEPTLDFLRSCREKAVLATVRLEVLRNTRYSPLPAFHYACAYTSERILDVLRSALKTAQKEKEPLQKDWGKCHLFVCGGGAAESSLWKCLPSMIPILGSVDPIPPLPLKGLNNVLMAELTHRFTVAAGLAVPIALWPSMPKPSQVPQASAATLKKHLSTSEELGYEQ
ncbi:MAG: hypothetical protein ACREQ4_11270 [Candidatus Binataceae bacterium]